MHRYKVIVSYIGKAYSGWQRQKNKLSVQEVIEEVINRITNESNIIVASGRTDSKVNARGQVFHFDSDVDMDNEKWKYGLNTYLPDDIYINSVTKVNKLFHARYCVLFKEYEYVINIGEYNVFNKDYVYHCFYKLDIDKMKEASKYFIGLHDFTSFCANPVDKFPNQVREIYSIDFSLEYNLLKLKFKGSGFLRYMVRMLVACLIEVGRNKLSVEDVKDILYRKDKDIFNKNAIASGLTLNKVEYFDLIYLDENYLIRTLHKEDERVLKDFYNKINEKITDENLLILSYRNKEEVLGLIKVKDDIELITYLNDLSLNKDMIDSVKKVR